jgi:LytTR family transcriptional regulator, CO-responsive transcriptional regulator RcoM
MQQANPQAEAQPAPGSWLYLLERSHIGLVHLDRELRVVGINDFARRCPPVDETLPSGKLVASFHPESSRAAVRFLTGQAECPVSNAPPMTMIINIPERMLLVEVSKVGDEKGVTTGSTLVFHDITEVISQARDWNSPRGTREGPAAAKRLLRKIPTTRQVESCRSMCSTYPSSARRATVRRSALRREARSATSTSVIGKAASIHRSYIINLSQVNEILRDDGRMSLQTAGPNRWRFRFPRTRTSALLDQLRLLGAATVRS